MSYAVIKDFLGFPPGFAGLGGPALAVKGNRIAASQAVQSIIGTPESGAFDQTGKGGTGPTQTSSPDTTGKYGPGETTYSTGGGETYGPGGPGGGGATTGSGGEVTYAASASSGGTLYGSGTPIASGQASASSGGSTYGAGTKTTGDTLSSSGSTYAQGKALIGGQLPALPAPPAPVVGGGYMGSKGGARAWSGRGAAPGSRRMGAPSASSTQQSGPALTLPGGSMVTGSDPTIGGGTNTPLPDSSGNLVASQSASGSSRTVSGGGDTGTIMGRHGGGRGGWGGRGGGGWSGGGFPGYALPVYRQPLVQYIDRDPAPQTIIQIIEREQGPAAAAAASAELARSGAIGPSTGAPPDNRLAHLAIALGLVALVVAFVKESQQR